MGNDSTTNGDKALNRAERTELRRAQILDAALALFAQHGERGTAIAAVAEAVGVTDAGVLYHFKTKAELLTAVLENHDRTYAQTDRPIRGVEMLRDQWGNHGYTMERTPDLTALYVKLSAEHLEKDTPTHTYFAQRYVVVRALLEVTFREAIEDGEVRADIDIDAEVDGLIAVIDGIRLHWFYRDRRIAMGDTVRHYVDRMLQRIAA